MLKKTPPTVNYINLDFDCNSWKTCWIIKKKCFKFI